MADTPAPAAVEPETGDTDAGLIEDDGIVLTRTGWIRCTIAGTTHRLRRPFMGEFRDLRYALAEIEDELQDGTEQVGNMLGEVTASITKVADGTMSTDDARALATRARKANRDLLDKSEDLRLDWWKQVFTVLGVDTQPDQWPSWAADVELPAKVIAHWRAAPLAPGH